MRIEPAFRRRDLAHFLVRQVEEENKENCDRISLDIDSKAQEVIRFFMFCGYKILFEAPLYCTDNIDVMMGKEYKRNLLNQA